MDFESKLEEAAELIEQDLEVLKQTASKRQKAGFADLEGHLNSFQDLFYAEVAKRQKAGLEARDVFDLRCRCLSGLSEEVTAFARKRPDSPCNSFKLQQVIQVLAPLKAELEAFTGDVLSLPDEDSQLSYSDISLLVRNYLELSTVYAWKRYSLRYGR